MSVAAGLGQVPVLLGRVDQLVQLLSVDADDHALRIVRGAVAAAAVRSAICWTLTHDDFAGDRYKGTGSGAGGSGFAPLGRLLPDAVWHWIVAVEGVLWLNVQIIGLLKCKILIITNTNNNNIIFNL